MNKKIVVTGLGVVSPNGIGVREFLSAIQQGKSGVRFFPELEALKMGCQIGGMPEISEQLLEQTFSELERKSITASGIIYGLLAGIEAWKDAGFDLPLSKDQEPDWDSGCIFGAGLAGARVMRDAAYLIDEKKSKRLGSNSVPQVMASGISAHLGGKLGLGNQVTTNASACSSGSESLLMGLDRIRSGQAKRMVCGGCDSSGPYVWAGFDAMRVTNRRMNDRPEQASRPMSASAAGFVPGAGAGAVVLENLESARARNATIYAEVLGGYINSGGQQNGGTMTAPNRAGILHCIEGAIRNTGIAPEEIDAISGHLTSTMFDSIEVEYWTKALKRQGKDFPYIYSLKSMIGHCLSAAGAIESVAAILQIKHGFLHPTINCEDLHPDIAERIAESCIPRQLIKKPVRTIAKSSFGFGDVNSVVIFRKIEV